MLKVLFRADGEVVFVDEVKGKIPHKPHETRKLRLKVLLFSILRLDFIGDIGQNTDVIQ